MDVVSTLSLQSEQRLYCSTYCKGDKYKWLMLGSELNPEYQRMLPLH